MHFFNRLPQYAVAAGLLTAASIAACDSTVDSRFSRAVNNITDAVILSDGSFIAVGATQHGGGYPAILSIDASGNVGDTKLYDDLRGSAEAVALFGDGLAVLVANYVGLSDHDFNDPTLYVTDIDGTHQDILFDRTTFDNAYDGKLYSTDDGGLLVVAGFPPGELPALLRYDASRQLEWSYEAPKGEGMLGAVLLRDGHTVVQLLTGDGAKLSGLDANGVELWETSEPSHLGPMSAAGDGFVMVSHSGEDSVTLQRLDGNGTIISDNAVVIPQFTHITAVTGFEDGGWAYAYETHAGTAGVIVRLRPDDSEAWVASVDQTDVGSLVSLPDGQLLAVGIAPSGDSFDVFAQIYD